MTVAGLGLGIRQRSIWVSQTQDAAMHQGAQEDDQAVKLPLASSCIGYDWWAAAVRRWYALVAEGLQPAETSVCAA